MQEPSKKEEKKIIKEEKKRKKIETKKRKKVEKELKDLTKDKKEILEIRKKRYIFETVIIIIFGIFLLILLCNRTFFREEYRTKKINLDIPLLTFFIKDDGNEIVFKTLRKSEYVKQYFDSYLSSLAMYNCGERHFYYDESTNTAIYDIDVEKTFALKTITVKYNNGTADCLCSEDVESCKLK